MLLWLCHVVLYGRRSIVSSASYHISQITCSVSAIMSFPHQSIGVMAYGCAMFYYMLDVKLLLQPETVLRSKHWLRTLSAVLYCISQEHNPVTMVTLQSECKGTYLTKKHNPATTITMATGVLLSQSLIHSLTLRTLYKAAIYVMRRSSFRAEFISL
jgi:hypothetical protein